MVHVWICMCARVYMCMQVGIEGIQMCIVCMLCFSVFVIWRALVYICFVMCMYAYVLCICLYDMQYVCICVWKLCACVYCGQYVLYNIHMIVCWYACTCKYSCLAFVYMCVKGYVHVCVCTILQVRTMVKASILDENSVWNLMHKRHQTLSSWAMKMTQYPEASRSFFCAGGHHTLV